MHKNLLSAEIDTCWSWREEEMSPQNGVLVIKCEENCHWLGLKYFGKSLFRLQSGKILGLGPSIAHLWLFLLADVILLQKTKVSRTSVCTKLDVDTYFPQCFSAKSAVVCFFFFSVKKREGFYRLCSVSHTCTWQIGEKHPDKVLTTATTTTEINK